MSTIVRRYQLVKENPKHRGHFLALVQAINSYAYVVAGDDSNTMLAPVHIISYPRESNDYCKELLGWNYFTVYPGRDRDGGSNIENLLRCVHGYLKQEKLDWVYQDWDLDHE